MGVTKEGVESTLTTKLQPTYLEVVDTSGGCGASFAVAIVSAAFEGKRLLERHRIVNTALTEEMKDIHALSIKRSCAPVAAGIIVIRDQGLANCSLGGEVKSHAAF